VYTSQREVVRSSNHGLISLFNNQPQRSHHLGTEIRQNRKLAVKKYSYPFFHNAIFGHIWFGALEWTHEVGDESNRSITAWLMHCTCSRNLDSIPSSPTTASEKSHYGRKDTNIF
jgi:hypothetical protein